jgi:hypothetical protein
MSEVPSWTNPTVRPHYPGMGQGLVVYLFLLSVDPIKCKWKSDQGLLFQGTLWLRPRLALSSFLGGWGTSRRALIENGLPGVGPYLG